MQPMQWTTNSEQETMAAAAALASSLRPGDVVALFGDLGAGKTAFVRGLAGGLGLDADEVSSPTFSLVNEYREGATVLYHFDMYRVAGFEPLESTGFFDLLDQDHFLAVEWSENIADFLPPAHIAVHIARLDEHRRDIRVHREGEPQ